MNNNLSPSVQLPAQLSTFAPEVDRIYDFIFWTSTIFFVAIVGTMIAFMIKYRRKEGDIATPSGHHNVLELFWTFSPLLLLAVMFHWGYQAYAAQANAPDDALNIRVTGQQWNWLYQHGNGMGEVGQLTVPAGRPVRLIMSSQDVLHSYFVPDFRVKRDLVPGMFTSLWFEAIEKEGMDAPECADLSNASDEVKQRCSYEVQVYCTEYCGGALPSVNAEGQETQSGHWSMLSKIRLVSAGEYARFLSVGPSKPADQTDEQWGQRLFAQYGCPACHSVVEGAVGTGPNFHGLYGRTENLADGSTVEVNDDYIRQSIREPRSQIVRGFNPLMPSFANMSENELNGILAYLKTVH